MPGEAELLKNVYELFNARDMEAVLATMHEDVIWANGMESGHIHGRDTVRIYWTRQWATIDSVCSPRRVHRWDRRTSACRSSPAGALT